MNPSFHDEAGCEAGRLAQLVSRQDWASLSLTAHTVWPCATCQRLAEVVLPAIQMLCLRVEAMENGHGVTSPVAIKDRTLAQIERDAMIAALQANQGVQNRAAKQLGLTPRVMSYKVKSLRLEQYCSLAIARKDTP